MAVVEDYVPDSDDEDTPQSLEEELPPTTGEPSRSTSKEEIKGSLTSDLVERLRVPPVFAHVVKASELDLTGQRRGIISALQECTGRSSPSDELSADQVQVYAAITRLRVAEPDQLITSEILKLVNDILSTIPNPRETAHALLLSLKDTFSATPHPEISSAGRKLARPVGGEGGRAEMFDEQLWKGVWGTWNTLRWCCEVLNDVVDDIPLILPPLLIMLDDYKSTYRLHALRILPHFLRIPPAVLKRTGIAQLLLNSLQHSISLHPTSPEPPILVSSLIQLFALLRVAYKGEEAEAAKQIEQAVGRGLVNGWAYAKSGREGAEALVGVAKGVELVCSECGLGVVRWLRTFIPALLSPCQIPPAPWIVPVQQANLQALHTLLQTIQSTGRAARWRGEIIDGAGRLVVALFERGVVARAGTPRFQNTEGSAGSEDTDSEDGDADERQEHLHRLLRACTQIFRDLLQICPSMKDEEVRTLLELDGNAFGFLKGLSEDDTRGTKAEGALE
ncbi:hypothetical protein NCC49_005758 [Naganishia albida]|nr:hypothetical protein NCC49_005758 [Naganishia albida]